jgi:hypothetical protein
MRERRFHEGLPPGLPDEGEWYVSELSNDELEMQVRGRFRLSPFARLTEEQSSFLATFLRCRGVLAGVERELGISYPTVRARLDALLEALGLSPTEVEEPRRERAGMTPKQREILERLEAGELTPEEAKQAMKEAAGQ